MNNSDFIIVGDTDIGECLVFVAGRKEEWRKKNGNEKGNEQRCNFKT